MYKDYGMDWKIFDDISKFFSYVFCYQFEVIGLMLDGEGWVDIDVLIVGVVWDGCVFDCVLFGVVVENNDKKCFVFFVDGQCICVV